MSNNQHYAKMSESKSSTQKQANRSDIKYRKPLNSFRHYILLHLQALFSSVGRIWHAPLASFMTIAVIAIALSLPAGLYVLLQNVQLLSRGWDDGAQISLFLKMDVDSQQAQAMMTQLKTNPDIGNMEYISPQQGLQQFEKQSGFGDVIQQLHKNPLPGVIIVKPSEQIHDPQAINNLLQQLKVLPQVSMAQLDMDWIKRLYGFINLAKRAVFALGVILGLAVLLIIGNTIRLSIQNYRAEIEVIKMVGATNAFIRRPFLYIGLLYGLIGAAISFGLISCVIVLLTGPVERLAGLYQTDFYLHGLDSAPTLTLLLGGLVLGFAGAWLAVGRQLNRIEPR